MEPHHRKGTVKPLLSYLIGEILTGTKEPPPNVNLLAGELLVGEILTDSNWFFVLKGVFLFFFSQSSVHPSYKRYITIHPFCRKKKRRKEQHQSYKVSGFFLSAKGSVTEGANNEREAGRGFCFFVLAFHVDIRRWNLFIRGVGGRYGADLDGHLQGRRPFGGLLRLHPTG